MADAWEKFKKAAYNGNLVKPGDRVLLAVSGGPDSICLLHLFWRLRKILPIELHAVYLDHGLRKESSREAAVVQNYGRRLAVATDTFRIPVREVADREKISLETAGRKLRYSALIAAAGTLKYNRIATGHTASDNAETMIMWLLRGTGTEGLAGIPLCRQAEKGVNIIRPMLPVTRQEVIRYLRSQKLSCCVDRSNFSPDYTRNRIRHQVIPLLRGFNPRVIEHLFNLSRILSAENDFLDTVSGRAFQASVSSSANRIQLDLKRFFRYNKIIQSRVLKDVLPERRSVAQIERLREWIFSSSRKMAFSRSWHAVKRNQKVIFRKNKHQ